MLGRDDDGVHSDGDRTTVAHLVLTSDLGLAIRANPRALAALTDLGLGLDNIRVRFVITSPFLSISIFLFL